MSYGTSDPSQMVFRQIRPAPRGGIPAPKPAVPRRRQGVAAACESCRERKVKCDGIRPQCSSCTRSKRVCQYTTKPSETRSSALKRLKIDTEQQLRDVLRSHTTHLQLVHALTTSADADAANILQKLRQGYDPRLVVQWIQLGSSILRHVQPSDVAKQASAGSAQGLAVSARLLKLPPITSWYNVNQEEYVKLFEKIKSGSQERGVEILRGIHQGHGISDMSCLMKDETRSLQSADHRSSRPET